MRRGRREAAERARRRSEQTFRVPSHLQNSGALLTSCLPGQANLLSRKSRRHSMSRIFTLAGAVLVLLEVSAAITTKTDRLLPIGGSHIAQVAVVLGLA